MLAALMRAYDRAAAGMATLGEAAWTVVEVLLFRLARRPVPHYPLRCQHCDRPIRRATGTHPASREGAVPRVLYRDSEGAYYCYRGIPHRPMPSIQ